MGGTNGGTLMYCPQCKYIEVCSAIAPSKLGFPSGQRWRYKDLQFFRRGRQCQRCFSAWSTIETNETFLNELIQLRDALSDLRSNAEAYIENSEVATDSLRELTNSLKALRALKVYKNAK